MNATVARPYVAPPDVVRPDIAPLDVAPDPLGDAPSESGFFFGTMNRPRPISRMPRSTVECEALTEQQRCSLIQHIVQLLRNEKVPEDAREAAMTFVCWLARRMPWDTPSNDAAKQPEILQSGEFDLDPPVESQRIPHLKAKKKRAG
ncbi:MAG: hypothetical protein AAGA56_15910 [Myxococcota bacterium]